MWYLKLIAGPVENHHRHGQINAYTSFTVVRKILDIRIDIKRLIIDGVFDKLSTNGVLDLRWEVIFDFQFVFFVRHQNNREQRARNEKRDK